MNSQRSNLVGFIPARAESSRFPGKPLADINGRPMIMRVYDRAKVSPQLEDLFVATDSAEILESVQKHGGKAILTSMEHRSGTDRIAEAADKVGLCGNDIAVNIQGDQPLFHPGMIKEVVRPLLEDPNIPMSTLMYRIIREEEIHHPNAVKTVVDSEGFALYFTRATAPYFRQGAGEPIYYKHHGIYSYRADFLKLFSSLPTGHLERAEGLEQLRALEFGFRIKVIITDKDSIEVDTPEDLERVRRECESLS
jgi:3-deoxy-manno-octulosonate cytidylyltransferase (CMP-KDO synthetase)